MAGGQHLADTSVGPKPGAITIQADHGALGFDCVIGNDDYMSP